MNKVVISIALATLGSTAVHADTRFNGKASAEAEAQTSAPDFRSALKTEAKARAEAHAEKQGERSATIRGFKDKKAQYDQFRGEASASADGEAHGGMMNGSAFKDKVSAEARARAEAKGKAEGKFKSWGKKGQSLGSKQYTEGKASVTNRIKAGKNSWKTKSEQGKSRGVKHYNDAKVQSEATTSTWKQRGEAQAETYSQSQTSTRSNTEVRTEAEVRAETKARQDEESGALLDAEVKINNGIKLGF